MWDFSIGGALGMMARTMPFIVLRMAVYFGIAVGYVLVTGTGAGIGYGIGGFGDEGFQASSTLWGGHIAVLVELIDGKPMPDERSQVSYATEVVKERFAQASVLFAIDQLIKGVVAAITGLVRGILSFLPLPGIRQISGILHAFLRVAVGFIDEVILAHAIRTRSTNPWASAKEALVLYGQNYKVMLKNAAWLATIVYLMSFLVFLVMLAPAALVVYLMPGAWAAGGLVFALLFAWSVKAALLEPFAIACLMQVYFRTIENQKPDPEWEARLEQMSAKFRKLKAKALDNAGAATPEGSDLQKA